MVYKANTLCNPDLVLFCQLQYWLAKIHARMKNYSLQQCKSQRFKCFLSPQLLSKYNCPCNPKAFKLHQNFNLINSYQYTKTWPTHTSWIHDNGAIKSEIAHHTFHTAINIKIQNFRQLFILSKPCLPFRAEPRREEAGIDRRPDRGWGLGPSTGIYRPASPNLWNIHSPLSSNNSTIYHHLSTTQSSSLFSDVLRYYVVVVAVVNVVVLSLLILLLLSLFLYLINKYNVYD